MKKKDPKFNPQNHIPASFFERPDRAECVLAKRALQETLHFYDGAIVIDDCLWDIKSKKLGVGLHLIYLKPRRMSRRCWLVKIDRKINRLRYRAETARPQHQS